MPVNSNRNLARMFNFAPSLNVFGLCAKNPHREPARVLVDVARHDSSNASMSTRR
jgi:hypothetical protein